IISFTTGIGNINVFKGISIYPNPAKDHLIIENNESLGQFDFEIVNSSGKIIYNSILLNKSVIDLNLFSSGIYLIRFRKDNSYYFLKFIKE
ncbi:MAG TPA: T9SS type A sorting domain-containing protein, partial [Ignavibacteria bacterium]